jgi:hypothetical protein
MGIWRNGSRSRLKICFSQESLGSSPSMPTTFMIKSLWRIWTKALGEKASADNREADRVALIRTLIVLFYVLTNIFIIAGVIRHW